MAFLLPPQRLINHVGKRWIRSRGGGSGSGFQRQNAQVLLERFVKRIRSDGAASLVLRAPVGVKIRASHFDGNNQIDAERNRNELLSEKKKKKLKRNPKKESARIEDEIPLPEFIRGRNEVSEANTTRILEVLEAELKRNPTHKRRKNTDDDDDDDDTENPPIPLSSGHFLLHGRPQYRVDSYSVIGDGAEISYMFLTDASSFEEAENMFGIPLHPQNVQSLDPTLKPALTATVWQPKPPRKHILPNNEADFYYYGLSKNKLTSAFKLFALPRLFETEFHLKCSFILPPEMKSICLQTSQTAPIEFDGDLFRSVENVSLISERGKVKVKNLKARDIELQTRSGEILCDGIISGNLTVQTKTDSDFFCKEISGNNVTVTTEEGDITVWSECDSANGHFFTQSGHVHVNKFMDSNANIVIRESGNVTYKLVSGSTTCMVRQGSVYATVMSIDRNSEVKVGDGEVHLRVPADVKFRLRVSAPSTMIAPPILNTGDFTVKTGRPEVFDNSSSGDKGSTSLPLLNVVVNYGSVYVYVAEEEKAAAERRSNEDFTE